MKYNDKKVSKMVLRKSSTYLRQAIIIFILTVFALGYALLCFISYINENKNNYTSNDNVHMIMVGGKVEDGKYDTLHTKDYKNIQSLLQRQRDKSDFKEIAFFQFVGASSSNNGEVIKIIGIDKNKTSLLGDMVMEDMAMYTTEGKSATIDVSVPITYVSSDGGFVSDKDVKYSFANYDGIYSKSVFTMFRHNYKNMREAYVTEGTLLKILKDIGKIPSDATNLYSEDLNGGVSIEEIFIYVDDIYQIDNIAGILKDNGYDVTYTFEAFDSLGASIKKTTLFLAILIVALLVTSASNVVLSCISYLRIQQKDMGILKFYGFSEKRIYNMYKRNIDVLFGVIGIILFAYILIIGEILLGSKYFVLNMIIGMLIVSIVVLIRFIVIIFSLKRIVKKDIIYLVKESKEFE